MRYRVYSVGIFFLAAAGAVYFSQTSPVPNWRLALLLGLLSFLAEVFAFMLPSGLSVSLSFGMAFAGVLLGGPLMGAFVFACSAIPPQDIRVKKPPIVMLFNVGQLALSGMVAGAVLHLLGVAPLLAGSEQNQLVAAWLAAAMLVALTQAVANMTFVGVGIHLYTGVSLGEVWRQSFRSYLASMVALALLGIVLAELLLVAGAWSVLLLIVPFVVARQTFQVYQHLEDSYRTTLRALIAVLEAKDPYTRGHSERVAFYSREIAQEMGLSQDTLREIEFAALLHDIGKVGIHAATLTKPERLTGEEFNEIKMHPLTGAQVLREINFLEDVLPLITAHHERLDGSGYPYGLREEDIPYGSQILAVADSFDAITSERAYCHALSYDEAIDELYSATNERLRGEFVDALVSRVSKEKLNELLVGGFAWGTET